MTSPRAIYEKLGAFYLGKTYDLDTHQRTDELTLYDSRDLVTHAVVVGMTGSGKTGLGIGLIEEAAIDGVPVIIVDPKGDMGNLLLNFPELQPSDFRIWINQDDAQRQGQTAEAFSAAQAELWHSGLTDWEQPTERIQALRDAAEFAIYTPGSDAGIPISILSSFDAPAQAVRKDSDLFQDRIASTATSLLALLGLDVDPLRSREHILLTTIFNHAWSKGQNLDLGSIIRLVQNPPFQKVGVMDLESFFPSKDRFELSMTLNNLLAAPGFASWMTGEPLDIDRILYTSAGKPRVSIFSISHLSDSERMFFVSLLLNQTMSWMRTRPGTTSLRAMLYIDEIFGYMPPVAEPPSKKPLLTLLKQARAYGLGVVLATQNPMDLDYKGLSNTGTWFIGRLQTDRDKDRVLDGLEGASADSGGRFDRETISEILSNLGKRVFLLHNVHESSPTVFQTRWALSYLAGPMTRNQIKRLMADRKGDSSLPTLDAVPLQKDYVEADSKNERPVLPADVNQVFLPARRPIGARQLMYQPKLLAWADVHFVDTRKGLSAHESVMLLTDIQEGLIDVDWNDAIKIDLSPEELHDDPLEPAVFDELPSKLVDKKSLQKWEKSLDDFLYRSRRYELLKSANLKAYSRPAESERDFRIRLRELAREERDIQIEKLRKKYANKLRALEDRVYRAEQAVDRERQQASDAKMQSAISFGATILSAVFGRKSLGRATSTARGYGRMSKQSSDVQRALQSLQRHEARLNELEREVEQEIDQLHEKFDPLTEVLDTIELKPRRTDIDVKTLAIAWSPCAVSEQGRLESLF